MASSTSAPALNASATFHNSHGNRYDRMSSGGLASIFNQTLPMFLPNHPVTAESNILDNACGTGLVSEIMKAHCPSVPITGADLAPGMIDVYSRKAQQQGWKNVQSKVQDVRNLDQCQDEEFSHVLTNFGFAPNTNDLEGPGKSAKEMFRVLKKGGVAVVTIWCLRNFDVALINTARVIRPNEEPYSWTAPDEWSKGWWLMKTLDEGGFGANVEVRLVKGGMKTRTIDDFVENLMFFKDMFYKDYNEEEVKRLPDMIKSEIMACNGYYEDEDGVGVEMISWVGIATKQ